MVIVVVEVLEEIGWLTRRGPELLLPDQFQAMQIHYLELFF